MTDTVERDRTRLAPPRGLETFAVGNLLATVGTGITLTSTVIYFVQVADLPATTVASAMSAGAVLGLISMPVVGRLAAGVGAKPVYLSLLGLQSLALVSWQFAGGPLAVFICLALSLVAERGINAVVGGFIADLDIPPGERVSGRAYLRSVTNVGLALGGGLAALGLSQDSSTLLRALVVTAAVMPCAAAVFVARSRTTRTPVATTDGRTVRPTPRPSPYRDRRYIALAVTNGVMAIHLDLLAVGLPLVLTLDDSVPDWVAGVAITVNAVLVIVLQVPVTGPVRRLGARRSAHVAGLSLSVAIVLLGVASSTPLTVALVALGVWIISLTCAELVQSALEFGVSYDAAPPTAHTDYQAAYAFGRGLVRAAAPVTLAGVASVGLPGWCALATFCAVASVAHSHLVKNVVADV